MNWLAGLSSLVYVLSRLVHGAPPDPGKFSDMDVSWVQYLHQAFIERLQFGRDVVFTFGPWGFLYDGYHPGTRTISVIAWIGMSVVLWSAGWKVARHFSANTLAAWLWVMAFTTVAGVGVPNIDTCLYAFIILLVCLYFFVEEESPTWSQAALTVSLALIVLIKTSQLVLAGALLGLMALDTIWRRRRFPWLPVLFGSGVLVFWIAAGQKLSTIAPFISSSREITGGFTEAMMLVQSTDKRDVTFFLLAALFSCALAGFTGWARRGCKGLLPSAAFGLVLFTSFKYGYVRHDAHEVAAALELLLVALAVLAIGWRVWRGKNWILALTAFLQAGIIFCFASAPFHRITGRSLAADLVHSLSPRKLIQPLNVFAGSARVRDDYEHFIAACPGVREFPKIQGTVDVYPWNDVTVMLEGAHYHPRPILQSYQAYTPALEEFNAAYLRHDGAPDYVLVRPAAIDYHLPTMDDGPSWLELLTRYDFVEVEQTFSLLRRSQTPREWKLMQLGDQAIDFGKALQFPPGNQAAIWVQIDADKTLEGSINAALYKPPILVLNLEYRDGTRQEYRLVPGMARSGFLLSPLMNNTLSFAELAAGDWNDLTNRQVAVMKITGNGVQRPTDYRSPLRLRFFRFEFPQQPATLLDSFRQLRGLTDIMPRIQVLHSSVPLQMTYWPDTGSVLAGSADSLLQVQPPPNCRHLQLGFGVHAPEDASIRATNAIEFQVSIAGEDGHITRLWSRRLDPAGNESDRGTQRASVDLGIQATSKLLLEVLPGDPWQNANKSCYLSELQFE